MDDLIVEFITETNEGISTLDLELVKLEKNPQDEGILGNIFRIMHTIKGTCGFLGLPRLEHVAHASENVLGKIRAKELEATPAAITLVLESLDSIKVLLEYLSENGTEQSGDDGELIARLNQYAETGYVGEVKTMAQETVAQEVATDAVEFPHFKGDDENTDDPSITEALERMAVGEFPHFKGDDESSDDPSITEALERMAAGAFPHFKGDDEPVVMKEESKEIV
jgi:chemotaxis protein histidine kinase CheA